MKGKVSNTGYKKNSKDKNNDYNIIPTNRITMKNVNFPVLGISDKNDVRVMYPGEEHLFDGNSVLEYRMAKNGINQQDQKVGEQLKQLTDFSNNSLKLGGNIKKSNIMKDQILKLAGVKTDEELYKLFQSEEAFMKVHGKEFKKAQTGYNNIPGYTNYGQPVMGPMNDPNLATSASNVATSASGSFNIYNPVTKFAKPVIDNSEELIEMPGHINNPNFGRKQQKALDAYNQQEITDITEDQSNPLGKEALSPFAKLDINPINAVMGAIGGIKNAFEAHREKKKLADRTETWANVSDVQKRAGISNAFAEKPKRQYFRQDDPMFIHNASELSNTQGRGSDSITQNGGVFKGGGEIQNTYAPDTLYDDLGYAYNDDFKPYQDGGKFGNFFNQVNSDLGGGKGFFGNVGVRSPFDSMLAGDSTGADLGGAISSIGGPGLGLLGTMAGKFFDKVPGRIKNAENRFNSNNAFASRLNTAGDLTAGLQNIGVGQNGEALQPYEDGGWVSNDWTPQVIASFGGLDEQEVYDYAHEGMDTLRAGGHMRDYTPISNRGMETYEDGGEIQSYAMGGQLKTHWGGEAEVISRNPYMPGSGEMVILNGARHGKEGGIGISYGDEQDDSEQTAKDGANTGARIEAETRETIMEMKDGGEVDPQTGKAKTSAVVLGNIAPSADIVKATGDQVLIDLFSKNPKKTFKRIGEVIAKDENKAESYMKIASDKANKADHTQWGALENKTADIIKKAGDAKFKLAAQQRIKSANLQSAVNDTKQDISYMKGKNISAEDLGKGKISLDYDPITKDAELENPYAKYGAYLRKAQGGEPIKDEDNPSITEDQYNELVKLYEKGKKDKKSASIQEFQHKYHQLFPNEALKAIQKTTKERGVNTKGKKMGLTAEEILSGKDTSRILESNEDQYFGPRTEQYMAKINSNFNKKPAPLVAKELNLNPLGEKTTPVATDKKEKEIDVVPYKRNKFMDYANMLSQFLPNAKLPGIDPRQFAGEYMAMSQNQYEPVPSQRMRMQLDPMTRVSYQDIRNQSTSNFKDALKQGAFNPAVAANVFGNKVMADQTSFAEEFRTNQGLEDRIYGGNRAKVNQEMATNLELDAAQMDKQNLAWSKTKETNQKAIASIADKYMQHDARNLEYNVKSNLFPKFGYDASGKIHTKGPGFQPVIPQVYGGKSSIKQVPVYDTDGKTIKGYRMQEGDDEEETAATRNGGSINKKNRSSVVKNAKNGSIVKLHKNF